MKPNHLLVSEINYELKIRGVVTSRDVHEKRKILSKALQKERNRDIVYVDPDFDCDTERVAVQATLDSIREMIQDFEGTTSDSVYCRAQTRLTHIINRIKRIVTGSEDEKLSKMNPTRRPSP
ncbi:hypothetical protein JTB14_006437 [Gonioctena quinquepunctata]|nr:hypothetical protein JTB14_006437 [Gonioctena quinquepunctata]